MSSEIVQKILSQLTRYHVDEISCCRDPDGNMVDYEQLEDVLNSVLGSE
jgi:hypothetical protein